MSKPDTAEGNVPTADPAPDTPAHLSKRALRAAVLDHSIFDPHDQNVKKDVIHMVIQYLHDEGYHGSAMVVQDETNVKAKTVASKRSQLRRMKRAILDGDWSEVERLLSRTTFRTMKAFKYAVHRQQFLELIEAQETQKAFSILQRRLKELEAYASTTDEFRDLCYLLTCKSVGEAASFRGWDGVAASRDALVEQYSRLLEFDAFQQDVYAAPTTAVPKAAGTMSHSEREVPPARLVSLLQQALAFQISSSRHMPKAPPRIGTLLEDYECAVVPNARLHTLLGHEGNVKCVTFVGDDGDALASGSSDNTVRVWRTGSGACLAVLRGHKARVWDVCATPNARMLASAGGDGCVRLWDCAKLADGGERLDVRAGAAGWQARDGVAYGRAGAGEGGGGGGGEGGDAVVVADDPACRAVLRGHAKDVYTVRFHPRGNALVSGGYDRSIRLYDSETLVVLKTFHGHRAAICSVAFNARGNMIISGSKDSTIKFWDIISGLCVQTINYHLGEVTCVETNRSGTCLLSSSKDNSNRLWDMRMGRAVRRFKGHQNTSKNFVKSCFGPKETLVFGGSEDGFVYVWDVATTDVVAKLGPTAGPVYGATWNARQSVLASCGHDGIVTTWGFDEERERRVGR